MGYNLSLIAVKGLEREEIWERLSLKCSGVAVELFPHGKGLSGGLLKSGWYLICGKPDVRPCPISAGIDLDTMRSKIELDSNSMKKLSEDAEVFLLYLQEHCLLVVSSFWQNSVEQWRISLSPENEDFVSSGDTPQELETMLEAAQNLSRGYLFDVPVKLFDRSVGFRYDHNESDYLVGEPDWLTTRKRKG